MTNLVFAVWLVVLTNAGVVSTNLVFESAPQKISVPLGPLLSQTAMTNIARMEATIALAQLTNSVIEVRGTNLSFTLTPKP